MFAPLYIRNQLIYATDYSHHFSSLWLPGIRVHYSEHHKDYTRKTKQNETQASQPYFLLTGKINDVLGQESDNNG